MKTGVDRGSVSNSYMRKRTLRSSPESAIYIPNEDNEHPCPTHHFQKGLFPQPNGNKAN